MFRSGRGVNIADMPVEIAEFFGPVTAMVAEGEEPGTFHVFRRTEKGLDHRRVNGV